MDKLSPDMKAFVAMYESDPQAMIKKGAKLHGLDADGSIAKLCHWCQQVCEPELRCSRCKAFYYCSKSCLANDWSKPNPRGGPDTSFDLHKKMCPRAVKHMERQPEYDAVEKLFLPSWLMKSLDGTSNNDLMLNRIGLLGYTPQEVGYWARPSSHSPHDVGRVYESKRYKLHGSLLLSQLPNEVTAWRLEGPKQIPRLHFDDLDPPPPPPGDSVVSWASWYAWRRLKLSSPVAMLMQFPLSVYWMLRVAEVVKPADLIVNSGAPRRKLVVHYVGIESELNYLPIFAELALLIPNCDIEMVFFGKAAETLVSHARKVAPRSPAAQEVTYSYQAPQEVGGSSFKAILFAEYPDWDPNHWSEHHRSCLDQLDAVVACNAGIGAYQTWLTAVASAALIGVPFIHTEYSEFSLELVLNTIIPQLFSQHKSSSLSGVTEEQLHLFASAPSRAGPILVNPFHKPGHRAFQVMTPNNSNGFVMRLC